MQREHGAFILARYSTDNQNADSIEVQVGKCSRWCEDNGLPILGVYADYAVSGMKDTRPQYEAMMGHLREGRADTVVIYDQSRMFRDISAWFRFRAELEPMGVRVVAVTQPLVGGDLRDPANFLNEGVGALFAHMWALQSRQKTLEKMRYMAQNGQHTGGKPALGYRVVDGRLAVDDAEAAVVRRIFAEYAGGKSYKQIIDGLNRDGLKTKRGNAFGRNSLHDLLKNERYIGVLIYGGRPYRADGSRNTHGAIADDAIRIENAVPAIIDRDLFDRVQERLAQNKRDQGGRPPTKREYPLKGKVFCGVCKGAMTISTSKGNYDYYTCTAKKNHCSDCDNKPIRVDKLEQIAAEYVLGLVKRPQLMDRLTSIMQEERDRLQIGSVERLRQLTEQESDVARKLGNAMDAVLDGLTSPALKKRIAELESQQRSLRLQLRDLRQTMQAADLPPQQLQTLLSQCLSAETSTALLSIVTRVEVHPDRVTIWTVFNPTPGHPLDYTQPGIDITQSVPITPGTPFGVPSIIVTPQFLRIVVAR